MKIIMDDKNSILIDHNLYAFPRLGIRIAYGKYSADAYQPMSSGRSKRLIRTGTSVAVSLLVFAWTSKARDQGRLHTNYGVI